MANALFDAFNNFTSLFKPQPQFVASTNYTNPGGSQGNTITDYSQGRTSNLVTTPTGMFNAPYGPQQVAGPTRPIITSGGGGGNNQQVGQSQQVPSGPGENDLNAIYDP